MDEMALYVKGKVSTTYAVVGLGYGERACACPQCFTKRVSEFRNSEAGRKGVKGRQGYLYNDGIYWVLRLFWLDKDLR